MKHVEEATRVFDKNAGALAELDDKAISQLAKPLLQLICEVCDELAIGKDVWLSIGATKKKDAFTVTLHAYNGSIAVFSDEAIFLLEKVAELL